MTAAQCHALAFATARCLRPEDPQDLRHELARLASAPDETSAEIAEAAKELLGEPPF